VQHFSSAVQNGGFLKITTFFLSLFLATSAFAGDAITTAGANWATNSYIAQFAAGSNVHAVADALAQQYGVSVTYYYEHAFTGMAFITPSPTVAANVSSDSRVIHTAQDKRGGSRQSSPFPGWALDRIDQHPAALDSRYAVGSRSGRGVSIYIVDAGINDLGEFGSPSRVENVFAYKSVNPNYPDPDFSDEFASGGATGHGTQVAAIAAGKTFGVARGASIKNVKVLGSRLETATVSNAIAGLDAVYQHFTAHNANWHPGGRCVAGTGTMDNPSVVNMSLAYLSDAMLDDAVLNLIGAGVVVVAGAGNTNLTDISGISPAHLGSASCGGTLTVGATQQAGSPAVDQLAYFGHNPITGDQRSNRGVGVRIFAPGKAVSAVNGLGARATFDGTSAASPYVAGAVAKHLAETTGTPQTPDAIMNTIVNAATSDAIKDDTCNTCNADLSGANNKLLYIAAVAAPVKGDFDGDGKPDIVWRNSMTGANAIWLMNGTTFNNNGTDIRNLLPVTIQQYRIVGADDFDGDGREDLLWRKLDDGTMVLWLLNGTTIDAVNFPATIPDPNYYVGGTGDFNGDGSPDILWRNGTTGANALWLMNRTEFQNDVVNLPSLSGSNYRFDGVGDFNGDGKLDIFVRNYAALVGTNSAWIMSSTDGTVFSSEVTLPPLPNTDYVVGGIADYNLDGKADVAWHNVMNAANAIWIMNGTSWVATVNLPVISNTQYEIEGPH